MPFVRDMPAGSGSDPGDRADPVAERLPDTMGFEVLGRHGGLGVVVGVGERSAPEDWELVVLGGRSSLLRFHIPRSHVRRISLDSRTVDVDADVLDFTARPTPDGAIELYMKP